MTSKRRMQSGPFLCWHMKRRNYRQIAFPNSPGRNLTFSPIFTAKREAKSRDVRVVPPGLGISRIMRRGKQVVNLSLAYCKNIEKPYFWHGY